MRDGILVEPLSYLTFYSILNLHGKNTNTIKINIETIKNQYRGLRGGGDCGVKQVLY
jgi:hypothetical protein